VYFIVICVIFANTLSVVLNFAEDRGVFLREQGNRLYAVWSYFLARTAVDIVPTFLCSLGLALVCFWMIGQQRHGREGGDEKRGRRTGGEFRGAPPCSLLNGSSRSLRAPLLHCADPSASGESFGRFLLLLVLLAYAGQGIGLVVSCGIGSRMLAMLVAPLAIAPFILFTPYAVNADTIPHYFRPVQVGSPFWWGFTGLMVNFFSGARFHCTPSQTIAVPLADGTFYLLCVYQTGEDGATHRTPTHARTQHGHKSSARMRRRMAILQGRHTAARCFELLLYSRTSCPSLFPCPPCWFALPLLFCSVLESFNISARGPEADSLFWLCCAVLLLLCVLYRLLALLVLYRLSWSVKDATK